MQPTVDIVIVNWNSGSMLRRCLESLESQPADVGHVRCVTVVDNSSVDGSVDRLSDLVLPLKIIRNSANRGFAAACNVGARDSTADYLLFLNPDTRLTPGSVTVPIEFMENSANRSVGIVGIQLRDEQGQVWRSSARLPTAGSIFVRIFGLDVIAPHVFPSYVMTEWDHASTRRVDHVIGAFFFVRRHMFEDLRGFDERFFMYLEDLDFSLRARRAGLGVFYLADAWAQHVGGGTSAQIKSTRLFYALRSRIQYGYKHLGGATATVLMLATLVIEPFARLAGAMIRQSRSEAAETVGAFVMLWRNLLGRPPTFRAGR